jgi:hypothetical protein
MRRALGGAALIALVLGAVLLAAGGGPSGQAHAAAAGGCVKHTKRIVKHVKRHGKWVRIVRLKHYWVCPKGVTPPSSSGGGGGGSATTPSQPGGKTSPGPGESPGSEPEPEANAVSVSTVEKEGGNKLAYALSRTSVKAGKVTIQLNNGASGDPHTMRLEKLGPGGRGSEPEIVELQTAPGKQATTAPPVELAAGRYRMWCTLDGHAERGMETTLEVTAE